MNSQGPDEDALPEVESLSDIQAANERKSALFAAMLLIMTTFGAGAGAVALYRFAFAEGHRAGRAEQWEATQREQRR